MAQRGTSPAGMALAAACLALAGCGGTAASGQPASDGSSCAQEQTAGGYTITITPSGCPVPARVRSPATITVRDAQGQPVSGATIVAHCDMTDMKMPTGTATARQDGDAYRIDLPIGMAGKWAVQLTVTPPGGAPAETVFTFTAAR